MKKFLIDLLSRYVEGVTACRVTPIESLFRSAIRGPLSFLTAAGPKQFAGLTSLASGTAFATVSTALVTSGMLINHSFAVATTVASGSGGPATCVSSIVDGVSFALGYVDGTGRGPGGTFMWELRRTR